MKKLFILKVGTTFKNTYKENGDFENWVIDKLDNKNLEISILDIQKGEKLPIKDIPNSFKAHTIHSQTVSTLPPYAVRLAYNSHEDNHAFRIGKNAWGVQFHPEYNNNIMKSYINEVSKIKELPKDKLLNRVEETNEANLILKRFGQIVEKEVKDND